MPERIQLSRRKGWRKPPNTVVVARPSKWGNPFRVIGGSVVGLPWFEARERLGRAVHNDGDAMYSSHSDPESATAAAVDTFRTYCDVARRDHPAEFEAWIAPLRGKNLACWCKRACHVDVLLEIANSSPGRGVRNSDGTASEWP